MSLATTYSELQVAVAHLLGFSRTSTDWDTDESYTIEAAIKSGYRKFLYPSFGGNIYRWSFLKGSTSLATVDGTNSYAKPTGLSNLLGAYLDEDVRKLIIVPDNDMLVMQTDDSTGKPERISISELGIMLYPNPDAVYSINLIYEVLPDALSASNATPLGADVHSETILAACLASADLSEDDVRRERMSYFQECLVASISEDRKRHIVDSLGTMNKSRQRQYYDRVASTTVNDVNIY